MIPKQAGAFLLSFASVSLFMSVAQATLKPEQAQAGTEELGSIAASLDTLAESAASAGGLAEANEQLDFDAETIITFIRDDGRAVGHDADRGAGHGHDVN